MTYKSSFVSCTESPVLCALICIRLYTYWSSFVADLFDPTQFLWCPLCPPCCTRFSTHSCTCTIGQPCEQPFQTHPKQLIFNENKRLHVNPINGCEMVDMFFLWLIDLQYWQCQKSIHIPNFEKIQQVTALIRTCGVEVKCRRLRCKRSLVQIRDGP
jgi:hypothetical protein